MVKVSIRKTGQRKRGTKERGKIFQMKIENICLKQIKDHIVPG